VKKSLIATAVVLAVSAISAACGEPIVSDVAPPEPAPTVNTTRWAQSDESLIMGPTGFGYGPAITASHGMAVTDEELLMGPTGFGYGPALAASHGIAVTDEELLMGPTGFGYGPVRTFGNTQVYQAPPLTDEQNKALQMRDQILMGY